jgi:hypothetical protein
MLLVLVSASMHLQGEPVPLPQSHKAESLPATLRNVEH